MIKIGIVEECKEVLDWIGEEVGENHEIYAKQKMIMTTLDAQKSTFYGGKDG